LLWNLRSFHNFPVTNSYFPPILSPRSIIWNFLDSNTAIRSQPINQECFTCEAWSTSSRPRPWQW